jgi:hypothetical protein
MRRGDEPSCVVLLIHPFTDRSVVVTGSHSLGYEASYANDDNLVVIRNA